MRKKKVKRLLELREKKKLEKKNEKKNVDILV